MSIKRLVIEMLVEVILTLNIFHYRRISKLNMLERLTSFCAEGFALKTWPE